jgi:hypothetical protein
MPCKHLTTAVPPGCTPCATPCNTPYHQEETVEKGGAAVMRMMLGSQKVGLTPLPTQQELYDEAITHNLATEPAGTWYIDPQGLAETLIHFKPAAFTNTFINYSFPNTAGGRGEANQKIVFTIETYEVAPAVVVADGGQWIAVVGYLTNAAGQLQSFFVNDPRPPIVDGTGDPPDFEVPAATWNANYMQPVAGGAQWNNQFTMVCDPKPPRGELAAVRERPLADGRRLIDPDRAVQLTRQVLEERGTLRRELFARAVGQGTVARPQLVQNLDREDQYYYLVRFQRDGRDAAVVALDARFGIFLEAIAYHQPVQFFRPANELPRLLARGVPREERLEDVRDRLLDRWSGQPGDPRRFRRDLEAELARLREPLGRYQPRPEEVSVHPVMVWQPSPGSMSMLYPYYLVNTPKRRLYVRAADGEIFTRLGPLYWQRLGG